MDPIRCVEECERCHRTCLRTAMNCYLEAGTTEIDSPHFRSLLACSDMCRTTINVVLTGHESPQAACALCARICTGYAESWDGVDYLRDCVAACLRCADACADVSTSPTGNA